MCQKRSESISKNPCKRNVDFKNQTTQKQNFLEECDILSDKFETIFSVRSDKMFNGCNIVTENDDIPMCVKILIENEPITFEIDTGSPILRQYQTKCTMRSKNCLTCN